MSSREPKTVRQAGPPRVPPQPEEMLTVAEAAWIARRCVGTLRRAYRRGSLRAYQDGNGRTIRIGYACLRARPLEIGL
jgi:hypothetical protein